MKRSFLNTLLEEVRRRFYAKRPARDSYADERWLTKALTWPAAWMRDEHGYTTEVTPQMYRRLIEDVLEKIEAHGNWPQTNFFPSYLLKCLQDHCRMNADTVLAESKHMRNRVDFVALARGIAAAPVRETTAEDFDLAVMAKAHALLATPKAKKPAVKSPQLRLL